MGGCNGSDVIETQKTIELKSLKSKTVCSQVNSLHGYVRKEILKYLDDKITPESLRFIKISKCSPNEASAF